MSDTTSETFRRALAHEPALTITLDEITREGTRLRRRHRLARAAGVAATLALVGGGFLWFPWSSTPASAPTTDVAAGGGPNSSTTGSAVVDPGAVAPNSLARSVAAASPTGLTFHWSPGAESDSVGGTVTGVHGTSGFSVGLSTSTQQIHPCRDPEFTTGTSCTERTLASGAVLSLRGLSDEPGGIHSLSVVLTYPDGSGVNAGSINATMSEPDCISGDDSHVAVSCYSPGAQVTEKPVGPTVTAQSPGLSLDDLVAIVTAVDGVRQR